MKIGFDAKRYYHNFTGLGNYSRAFVDGMQHSFPENDYVLFDEKSLSRTFRMGRKAKAAGCDVFHGLSNELPFDIERAGIPSVVTMHDVAWRTFPKMYNWSSRQIYEFKYGHSCRIATRVIAISENTKRDVMRFYDIPEERIEILYQPVQKLFYTPLDDAEADALINEAVAASVLSAPLPKEGFILNVGSINARKNLLGLVKSLERIGADQRPVLLVVGNGREYKREVQKYIAAHHLEQYVRIDTQVRDNRLLQALYKRSMAMVYPSFYEGFGLPVVEAALQHTPVITTTVSSLPEAAGPDACLFDPNADDAAERMRHYIERLTQEPGFAEEVATKGETYAREHFSPETIFRQLEECYRSL